MRTTDRLVIVLFLALLLCLIAACDNAYRTDAGKGSCGMLEGDETIAEISHSGTGLAEDKQRMSEAEKNTDHAVHEVGSFEERHISGFPRLFVDLDHMSSEATYIIRAVILDTRNEVYSILLPPEDEYQRRTALEHGASYYFVHTVYRLRVIEVFKGRTMPGDIIEFAQIGGETAYMRVTSTEFMPIHVGEELVFFLYDHYIEGVPIILANSVQSVYRLPPSYESVVSANPAEELESVRQFTGFTLSFGDLSQIAERYALQDD